MPLRYCSSSGCRRIISAGGVHPIRGASCSNFHEVAIKQAVVATAVESILVVDASKLGSLKPAFFADLDSFAKIVVGGAATSEVRKSFRKLPLDYATKAR